jgi:hypothetical protein
MPMVTTGPISLGGTATSGGLNQSVNVELGRSGTATINMNDSAVRSLAGVPSGAISMNNFYGKSNAFVFNRTISANTQNYNLLNDMVANGYVNGSGYTVNITINSGVYVWSDSTSIAGFDTGNITGTGTINITNSGFIMGRGGTGGGSASRIVSPGVTVVIPGLPGGPAINTVRPLNITNNSFIAGGGGGGATFVTHGTSNSTNAVGGGGGAGGGVGGAGTTYVPSQIFTPGGAGGGLGSSGGNGSVSNQAGGGGGGRILPGVGGPSLSNGPPTSGAGGSGGNAGGTGTYGTPFPTTLRVQGGLGGGAGGSGALQTVVAKAGPSVASAGGGGGWGAIGGNGFFNTTTYSPGGAGGKAINTNGSSITFITTGTVYGAVN